MNPGELKYKGRRVNPATFKVQGKDLRRLVGKCLSCGCTLQGTAATPRPDAYNSDVYGDETPVVQCALCNELSAANI